MPDERFLHRKLGHSEKVTALTDLQYRVWVQYVLSADDFGVLRASPVTFQSENDALGNKSTKVLSKCIQKIVALGLVVGFEHQHRGYLCQLDWQDYQHIRFPRLSSNPSPPNGVLERCTPKTRALFALRTAVKGSGETSEVPPKSSGDFSEVLPVPARAGGREWREANGLQLKANPDRARARVERDSAVGDPDLAARAGRFLERYAELFHEYRNGAHYLGRPAHDGPIAVQLCRTWDDDRLEKLVILFLTTNDTFCRGGSGSVAQFLSRASWCDAKLKEAKI